MPQRVVLVGWGAIGRTVAELVPDTSIELVGIAVRDLASGRSGVPETARLISDPSELPDLHPDVVVEAAGRDAVRAWGDAALRCGADFVVSSVSAFADAKLLRSLTQLAASTGRQLQIQPGAVAGIEALAAARHMGIEAVEHRMVKPPQAWLSTPAEALCDLQNLKEPCSFFSATAAEAAAAFPKNANVAMTTALAGIGPDATTITLVADPSATMNRHELNAHGAFGALDVSIANAPLLSNPKSSAMAALSLVRLLHNRAAAISI